MFPMQAVTICLEWHLKECNACLTSVFSNQFQPLLEQSHSSYPTSLSLKIFLIPTILDCLPLPSLLSCLPEVVQIAFKMLKIEQRCYQEPQKEVGHHSARPVPAAHPSTEMMMQEMSICFWAGTGQRCCVGILEPFENVP